VIAALPSAINKRGDSEGEEGTLWVAFAGVRPERLRTGAQAIRQIGRDGHEPRFSKLPAPHGQHLLEQIDIPVLKRQQLSASESREQQHA